MRLALPKGRNLTTALDALRIAGLDLADLESGDRRLRISLPGDVEVLLIKDRDVPLYVSHGIADVGVVGSDVLEETGDDTLLVPARFTQGTSRLSLIGKSADAMPSPGDQVRLATKYPVTARDMLAARTWGAEIIELSGSIELAPLLELAELALDIVQTGRTLHDNHLVELETIRHVAPCWVTHRAAWQRHRRQFNDWLDRFTAAGLVSAGLTATGSEGETA
ncbi:MAG: ATP phosphoribosyltransferase [Acidobacteriota bacterium]